MHILHFAVNALPSDGACAKKVYITDWLRLVHCYAFVDGCIVKYTQLNLCRIQLTYTGIAVGVATDSPFHDNN